MSEDLSYYKLVVIGILIILGIPITAVIEVLYNIPGLSILYAITSPFIVFYITIREVEKDG